MASGSRDKRVRPISNGGISGHPHARSSLVLGALLLGAQQASCTVSPEPIPSPGASGGSAGFSSGGAEPGAGAVSGSGSAGAGGFGTSDPGVLTCTANAMELPLQASRVENSSPTAKVLYSWTTPEQVAELRRDQQLFIRSEQAGMGRGFAFTALASIPDFEGSQDYQLAQLLTGELFAKIRYAWPHPWATRLGFPGEDYGNQLLRIVLKDTAWTVLVRHGSLTVQDLAGNIVPTASALATPERIGAIFFVKDEAYGGASCQGTFQSTAGGATYREFILGNEAMIEEWSLGTPEILQRLMDDIGALSDFLTSVRECSLPVSELTFDAGCTWAGASIVNDPRYQDYLLSLSMASDNYQPRSAQIARLIETLESDLFEPDPLRVTLGE